MRLANHGLFSAHREPAETSFIVMSCWRGRIVVAWCALIPPSLATKPTRCTFRIASIPIVVPSFIGWKVAAYIYVCGDAQRMAKDVHDTFIRIVSEMKPCTVQEAKEICSSLPQRSVTERTFTDFCCSFHPIGGSRLLNDSFPLIVICS